MFGRAALRFPLLNGFTSVIVTGELDAGVELQATGLAFEAASQQFDQAVQAGGGDGREVASGQFGLEAAQFRGEGLNALLFGSEDASQEILPFDAAQVFNEVLVLAAPMDERAQRHVELPRNGAIAEALGPQLDELLNRFLIFHNWLSVAFGPVAARVARACHTVP